MHRDRLFRITLRIQQLLLRELSHGIDIRRMINERRYARDVLLVCDARPGTDLASLALHFRATQTAIAEEAAAASSEPPKGLSVAMSSLFGTDFELSRPATKAQRAQPAASQRWFSPMRWLARS